MVLPFRSHSHRSAYYCFVLVYQHHSLLGQLQNVRRESLVRHPLCLSTSTLMDPVVGRPFPPKCGVMLPTELASCATPICLSFGCSRGETIFFCGLQGGIIQRSMCFIVILLGLLPLRLLFILSRTLYCTSRVREFTYGHINVVNSR